MSADELARRAQTEPSMGMSFVVVGDALAADTQVYDGPWAVPDALRKFGKMARYSQSTTPDGFFVTGMAYARPWTATNQVPEQAVSEGLLSRYGMINLTDGGDTWRFSLSGWFVAGTGGVIGIWPPASQFRDLDALAEGIASIVAVIGPAHVGIGSD